MADARVEKLARVMVNYALELKPGQTFWLRTTPLAEELNLAVYEEAVKAGAHVFVDQRMPGAEEIFYKYASDEQLDYISPLRQLVVDTFDASLYIDAEHNSRNLSGIDGARLARTRKAGAELFKKILQRSAEGSYRWCITVYPTHSMAQDADMSLADYREFVYRAGMLNEEDPVRFWKEEGRKQTELAGWLKGRDRAVLKGSNVDITLSIQDRPFEISDGRYNFPDGEIFTSPVEDSVNGWIRFKYPALYDGQEVTDIELWFENGRVVKEKAAKNEELLTSLLNTDPGARVLGEWGIGTNYGIQRFSKNMLFDEKIGGTIHFAVGQSFPECGGKNESGLHWDMLCDMAESEITIDGDLFYKDGKTVIYPCQAFAEGNMSSAFWDAIKQGQREEVERLLDVDPGLIHLREGDLSPILVAAYHEQPEIASFLADKTVALTIFEAAATGKINNVLRLLARDPQLVNAFAGDGFQALGLACYFGHFDVAEYLVKAGAPVNFPSRNDLKASPIHSAAAAGHARIVGLLLRYKADPNAREQGGYTPLHAAAQNGDREMIRTLLYGGADLTLQSDDGKLPLDLALAAGHSDAARLLQEGITKQFRLKRE